MTREDLGFHAFCLTDTGTRLDEYGRALAECVRPGDVVLDLGAGTGILSILARRAGARHVYAVEESPASALGMLLTSSDREGIEFITAPSSHVTLPERVDVIVGDIWDTFGLQARGLSSFIDARTRLLKPGGHVIPDRFVLYAAPAEASDIYARAVDVWSGSVQGVDLTPLRGLAVNQVHAGRLVATDLLAAPVAFATIGLREASTPLASGTATATVLRPGTLHGLCGCFVATLADGVTVGNRPGESRTSNFAHAFLPIDRPVEVAAGDTVEMAVQSFDGLEVRWRVEVRSGATGLRSRFDHSTFAGQALSLPYLRKQADSYRPRLTPRGVTEHALLSRFDGTHTAAELEAWLLERFPEVAPSRQALANLLRATIERCG